MNIMRDEHNASGLRQTFQPSTIAKTGGGPTSRYNSSTASRKPDGVFFQSAASRAAFSLRVASDLLRYEQKNQDELTQFHIALLATPNGATGIAVSAVHSLSSCSPVNCTMPRSSNQPLRAALSKGL